MANGTQTKPKVELALNQSAELTLTKDRPYVGENTFGTFYLYSVSDNGIEKSFFASPDVHQKIAEAALTSGDVFRIGKVAVQNGKKVTTKVEFSVVEKKNGTPQPVEKIPFDIPDDGFKELMRRCVQEAVEIVKEVNTISWQNEDVRSIAVTLFIQRMRA